MSEEITQTDGLADGMLLISAASYPVVRRTAGMVGGVIDEARRKALIDQGAALTQSAAELLPLVRSKLESIGQALQPLAGEGLRRQLKMAAVSLEDRIRWFSPNSIKEFVESNPVMPGYLYNELAEFLAAPIREAIDAVRREVAPKYTGALEKQLRDLEKALVTFAAEKFQADISRDNEPSHLMRSWWLKALRLGAIVLLGVAGLLAIAYMSL